MKRLKDERARVENFYVNKRINLDADKLRNILKIGTADAVEGPINLRLPTEYSSNGLSSEYRSNATTWSLLS